VHAKTTGRSYERPADGVTARPTLSEWYNTETNAASAASSLERAGIEPAAAQSVGLTVDTIETPQLTPITRAMRFGKLSGVLRQAQHDTMRAYSIKTTGRSYERPADGVAARSILQARPWYSTTTRLGKLGGVLRQAQHDTTAQRVRETSSVILSLSKDVPERSEGHNLSLTHGENKHVA